MNAEEAPPCPWDRFLVPHSSPEVEATVLIVEDDEDLACLLEYRLRRERLTPVVARDGEAACRALARNPTVELVLLDLLLPIKDGWEVCRFIRQHPDPRLASLPVIMLSALTSDDNRVRGMECGADLYLAKPYSAREVILASRQLLARRRAHRDSCAEAEALRQQGRREDDVQRMVFHELRSQCTVIGGLSRRLLRGGEDTPVRRTDSYRKYLEVIGRSASQLSALAEESLLLSQARGAGLTALPAAGCHLDQVVAEVVAVCGAKAELKGICLTAPALAPRTVGLPRLGLMIILSSLIENAIKYSPPATEVTLTVTPSDARLYLEVLDHGPGIPDEEQRLIFAPYYRGRAARLGLVDHGSGLGLYLVRRLTEDMGGEVTLASPPEGGCRFCVDIPIPKPIHHRAS